MRVSLRGLVARPLRFPRVSPKESRKWWRAESVGGRCLVAAMIQRQSQNITFWSERLDDFEGLKASRAEIHSRIDWSKQEVKFTESHRDLFVKHLA